MGLLDIFKASSIKAENERLMQKLKEADRKLQNAERKIREVGCDEYLQTKEKITAAEIELNKTASAIASNNELIAQLNLRIQALNEEAENAQSQSIKQQKKLLKNRELFKSISYSIKEFHAGNIDYVSNNDDSALDEYAPSIILKLHCMDIKDLRKAYNNNDKQINAVLSAYSSRYSTKANQAIYNLMVIALRAELQNILYNLKYEKLDKSVEDVKIVTQKYLAIAGAGNQSIAGTLTKFIGEIEYLFINAVKIEYNYYVKKEQARQEQLAIREQMRQEAEERKALEAERKKIEIEETKYQSEINRIAEQMKSAAESEIALLKARLLEVQAQLSDVVLKKDEIASLQNGKAGNIYIISNLGSFGESVFKIGMTRRIDPQERVNELGDASVPFRFDVHSFIFSEDAVGLESKLHEMLNDKRVNKVNLRKEFFNVTLDELEKFVNEVAPSAEFNRTMLAEEFRQSQSTNDVYSHDFVIDTDEEADAD